MSAPTPRDPARFFTAERPYDGMKDDCLLDAMEQTMEIMQDAYVQSGFTITARLISVEGERAWRVRVTDPQDRTFFGTTVREALREVFNAE